MASIPFTRETHLFLTPMLQTPQREVPRFLGTSAGWVLRHLRLRAWGMEILQTSREQTHGWNCPYQFTRVPEAGGTRGAPGVEGGVGEGGGVRG